MNLPIYPGVDATYIKYSAFPRMISWSGLLQHGLRKATRTLTLTTRFERLHPRPEWASSRLRIGTPSLSSLLASTKSFIDLDDSTHAPLPQGTIEMRRLRNANEQSPTTGVKEAKGAGGGVVDFAWHPSKRTGVIAVAGGDRRVRFFQVDGHTNPTLLTLHIPSLKLEKATFHPSGSTLLLTGPRPFYYTYDLPSARCIRSARNMFGSVPTPTSPQTLVRHAFSPDGTMLAIAGRRGAVSVMHWNGGVGAVIAELRSGRGGGVEGLVWAGQDELWVLGGREGSEVECWDLGQRRVVRKWGDEGAFGGKVFRLHEGYAAIG
jgi:U3 small nucleolar RNA-associated protein 18